MKNVKLFCQMAMHIKTVKECNVEVGNIMGDDDGRSCCFIGNIFRSGIGNFNSIKAYHLSRNNSDAEWLTTFGVHPHHALLFPLIRTNDNKVTGEAYYKECIKFLKDNKVLSILRRMENQAKAA